MFYVAPLGGAFEVGEKGYRTKQLTEEGKQMKDTGLWRHEAKMEMVFVLGVPD